MAVFSPAVNASNTADEIKDLWQTPKFLFDRLSARFQFGLDAASSARNALCGEFITERMNALVTPWNKGHGSAWLNPPYSLTLPFVERCRDQSAHWRRTVAALIPAATGTTVFHEHIVGVAAECWFFKGRIAFVNAATGMPVRNTNFESMLVVWSPELWDGSTFLGSLSTRGMPVKEEQMARWERRPSWREP